MILYGLAEIINKTTEIKTKKDKVEFLRKNNSVPLRTILKLMFDRPEWLLPDSPPPYKPSEFEDSKGLLFAESRRLRIFYKGGGYDNLDQTKRESLFISLLEDVSNDDAKLLVDLICGNTYKGLTRRTVQEAFPGLLIEEVKK